MPIQYLCEKCGVKRDAVRAIELHRLPAVLSIQLLRYVYSAKTGQRKKMTAAVSLPLTLDMGPRVGYVHPFFARSQLFFCVCDGFLGYPRRIMALRDEGEGNVMVLSAASWCSRAIGDLSLSSAANVTTVILFLI